jgi:DNA (cytosine-5)-methyltransferase 1
MTNRITVGVPERKSVELFAGAGGLGIGLAQSGFEPQLVVEHNKWCCDTLRDNESVLAREEHGGKSLEVIEGDIRSVEFARFDGTLDLVSGGPPCQPFSLGGRHRAYDDARDMFPQAVRALREARPKAFVFENVKGLMRASFQNYFEYVQLQMEHPEMIAQADEHWEDHLARLERHHTRTKRPGLHYRVVTRLLNSANYGVPQKRERVLFVGFRDDVDARWSFDAGDHSMEALVWDQLFGDYWDRHRVAQKDRKLEGRSLQLSRKLSAEQRPQSKPWKTTRDAIADLPDPRQKRRSSSVFNHSFQDGARTYPGHTGSYLDEPAKTLKAGVHGVPGGENMLRRANGTVRYFSTREAARLQTFPDNYKFHGAWSECMRQLGNAVPVHLAQVVGDSVAQQLTASEAG